MGQLPIILVVYSSKICDTLQKLAIECSFPCDATRFARLQNFAMGT